MMSAPLMSSARKRASAITPRSIFGSSAVRLELDFTKGIVHSSAPSISTWEDQSTYGHDLTNVVGDTERPVLTGAGVEYDGSNDHLSIADNADLDPAAALIVAFSFIPDVVVAAQGVLTKSNNSTTTDHRWGAQLGFSRNRFWLRPGTIGADGPATMTAAQHEVAWVYDGGGATDADRLKLFQDDFVTEKSLTIYGTIPATLSAQTEPVVLGAWSTLTEPFDGEIRKVALIFAVPTAGNLADLKTWLQS